MVCTTNRLQVVATLEGVASPEDCCRVCQASTARCTVCGAVLAEGQRKRGGLDSAGSGLVRAQVVCCYYSHATAKWADGRTLQPCYWDRRFGFPLPCAGVELV